MADRETVTVRHPHGAERQISKTAVPFFVNKGFKVLTTDGRVNSKATSAATTTKEH